jgi:hypothetical protein
MMLESTVDGTAAHADVSVMKIATLHGSIERAVRNEMRRIRALSPMASSTLRSELREICADAKRLDMRAELLVIAIKKVWQEIPETRSFARPREMDSVLNDAVTMTLDEFYRTAPMPRVSAD